MVELFEQIEEGLDFKEAANTPTQGGKVFNIAYLMILRIGGMGKDCEQWEEMKVGQNIWKAFKDHFLLA